MIYPAPLTVNPPLYLLTARAACYECGLLQPIIGLAVVSRSDANEDDGPPPGPAVLNYVTDLPAPLLAVMFDRSPRYRMHYSVTAKFDYYMNLCECGAKFGDHFLSERPGGAFMPLYEGDTDGLTAEQLPFPEPIQVSAGSSRCTPDLEQILATTTSP